MRIHSCLVTFVLLASACSGETETPAPQPEAPSEAPAETAEAESEAAEEPPPPPATPPINLLAGVQSALAVSSVYRGHDTQVMRMVDGDPATAWNSETDDLVGAWIEVRVPDEVQVTGARIVVGFTHEGDGGRDLFTANQRVRKMKVSRDGAEVGEFTFDTNNRESQDMEFEGPGGTYRFEITEMTAGSNADWKETCIAEFQLMGRADDAGDGRMPQIAVGELPPPPAAPDRSSVLDAHRQYFFSWAQKWNELEDEIQDVNASTGEPEPDEEQERIFARSRQRLLDRAIAFAGNVDPASLDALRRRAAARVDWMNAGERRRAREADLAAMEQALGAVATWLEDEMARCRYARAAAGIRVHRIAHQVTNAAADEEMGGTIEFDDMAETWEGFDADWSSNTRGIATRIARLETSPMTTTQTDWDALRAAVAVCQETCGW